MCNLQMIPAPPNALQAHLMPDYPDFAVAAKEMIHAGVCTSSVPVP